jgi:hypothetical protein
VTETFKAARFGSLAWIWTLSYLAIFLFFMVRIVLALAGGTLPDPVDVGFGLLLLVVVVYTWMRSVRAYSIDSENLTIIRSGPGRVNMALADITDAKVATDLGTFFNTSMLGVGGLFGWAGRARVRRPTDVRSTDVMVYGTNPANSLLLEMKDGRKVVLTPADPQAMESAFKAAGVGAVARPQSKPRPTKTAKKR